ncbi:MAG: HEAT repeat domain-containing protein [Halobacteriota archaeon]
MRTVMKRFCPNCGRRLDDRTLICPICGAQSRSAAVSPSFVRTCPACETAAAPDAQYCQQCGGPLNTSVAYTSDDLLKRARILIRRKDQSERWRRPLRTLRRTVSAVFQPGTVVQHGIPIFFLFIALLFIVLVIAAIAFALWPLTIAVVVAYVIGWAYTGHRYTTTYNQLKTSSGIHGLIEQLQSNDPSTRSTASDALVLLSADALPALDHALLGESESARQQAINTLVKIDEPAVVPLINALSDPREEVRRDALAALGQLEDPRSIPHITSLLFDTAPSISRSAAELLGEFGDVTAVGPLIQALESHDSDLKITAAHALGNLGDKRAIMPLTQLQDDRDPDIRNAAAEALGRLGGQSAILPDEQLP